MSDRKSKNSSSKTLPTRSEALAISIAVLIDRDPEMAGKIKQYVPEKRLAVLLQLSPDALPRAA